MCFDYAQHSRAFTAGRELHPAPKVLFSCVRNYTQPKMGRQLIFVISKGDSHSPLCARIEVTVT